MNRTLTLGHSPDPDDAFMFWALARDLVDAEGLVFEHVLQDIQTLNERAERSELDVTALSLSSYAHVAGRYRLTTCGASVGDGYGPLLVAGAGVPGTGRDALRGTVIAVPGLKTTAYLALRLYFPEAEVTVLPFDRILPAVQEGRVPVGLLIHEGQLTWKEHGVRRIEDLGAWWKGETGLPLPLGVNAVRRDLDEPLQQRVQRVLRRSIEHGLAHRGEAVRHAMNFGRGIDAATADRFVGMYVNDFTLDLGANGREAARRLLERAATAGLVPRGVPMDFVTD
jgi:1,4-dihydroxy-6-naphthoate synthase